MTWKDAYDKKHRPRNEQIRAFLGPEVAALFEDYSKALARAYGAHCTPPVYTQGEGWIYSFARSGVPLIPCVVIGEGAFFAQDRRVCDEPSLALALQEAAGLRAEGYAERYERETGRKKERRQQTTLRRQARERDEIAALEGLNPERLNRYRWSPKVPRRLLERLYEADARGLPEETLADEVGSLLYTRCLQGREERALIERGQLRCHACGAEVPGKRGLMQCACGAQYLFRDYMRSFRAANMPSGAASAIFSAFVERWPLARAYAEKMALVDGLVHEFHMNLHSGVKGRFVGVNLIEGSKKQIEALILRLAFGGAPHNAEAFRRNLRRE